MSEETYVAGQLTRHLQQKQLSAADVTDSPELSSANQDDALASLFAPRSQSEHSEETRSAKKQKLQAPEPQDTEASLKKKLLAKLQQSATDDEGRAGVKARAKLAKLREKARQVDPRNSRTVFVGNVSTEAKKRELLLLFRQHGPIESARFRSAAPADAGVVKRLAVIHKKLSRPSLNAYVVYKEQESVAKAVAALNGHCLRGNHLRVDSLVGGGAGKPKDNRKCVFLGNLHFKCDEESVRSAFSQCGSIDNVRLVRDSRSGIGRGFGFVQFADSASVELALRLAGAEIGGRPVRVTRCSDNPRPTNGETMDSRKTKKQPPRAVEEADEAAKPKKKKMRMERQSDRATPAAGDNKGKKNSRGAPRQGKASARAAPRPTNRTFAQAFQRVADKRKAAAAAKKKKNKKV